MHRDRSYRQRPTSCRVRPLESLESRRLMAADYHALASSAFAQDWSDAGQIVSADTWAGVPSLVGYLGDGLSLTAGSDPRVATSPTLGTPKVGANLTNLASSPAGVAEFALTDPVVALKGSGTALAPSLVLHLDTTGVVGTRVRFDARDIDVTAINTTQQVAVQYRLGETGPFINVPGAYVQDASRGPSLASLVTEVDARLPAEADDQPKVQVRILTTNAPSTDEWVGIDNISATATAAVSAGSFRFASPEFRVVEGAATAAITVVRGGGASGPASVSLIVGDGTASPGLDFGSVPTTLDFADGETSKVVAIPIGNDRLLEGDETVSITLSTPTGGATLAGQNTATLAIADDETAPVRLNEIVTNPDGTDAPFEYIEIRGLPGARLSSLSLLAINSDFSASTPGPLGVVNFAQDLSGMQIGASGLLVVKASTGGHAIPEGTTVVENRFLQEQSNLTNGSVTFVLVSSASPIFWGQDLDGNNDGVLDLPAGALLDSVGWTDTDPSDLIYGGDALSQASGTPDAASRRDHDLSASTTSAWFNGDLLSGLNSVVTYDATKASVNLSAGAVVTPGAVNFADPSTNRSPEVTADTYEIGFGETLGLDASDGLLANDSDPDGDPIAVVLDAPLGQESGSLEVGVDGSLRFVPVTGYRGTVTFSYHTTDGLNRSDSKDVTLTVDPQPNQPPVLALPESTQQTNEDTPRSFGPLTNNAILVSDPDAGSDPIKLTISVSTGTLTLSTIAGLSFVAGDGTADAAMSFTGTMADLNAALNGLVFTPSANNHDDATLSFLADDLGHNGVGNALTASGSFTITVSSVNDSPIALPDEASTLEDTMVVIDVLSNDSDLDGNIQTFGLESGPSFGTVVIRNGKFEYTPFANISGTDHFVYRLVDGNNASVLATVTISVNAVNDAPVLTSIADRTVAEGTPLTIVALATDVDDAAALIYSLDSGFPAGTTIDGKTGSITVPTANGPSSFALTVRATDPGGLASVRTFQVQVNNVAPIVSVLTDGSTNPGALLARTGSFADPGVETWTATIDHGDGSGVQPLVLQADKTFSLGHIYTNPGRFTAVVRVTDSDGAVGESRFVVVVNDTSPPVGLASSRSTTRRQATTGLELAFTGDLDAATAVDPGLYRLTTAGRDRRFGTRDDLVVALRTVAYDPGKKLVRITPRKSLKLTGTGVRLAISGLRDTKGRLVDGNGDGLPGGDLLAQFQKRGVTLLRR